MGMVSTQAQTIRPATPQRTAERRRVAPTPTMAPVMVCVVETGMPNELARKSVAAPAGDGREGVVEGDRKEKGEHQPNDRGDNDEAQRLGPAGGKNGAEADVRHRRAGIAADQRVRGAGGKSEVPGDEVPRDRADQ